MPILHTFKNKKEVATFLKQPPQFLWDLETDKAISHNDVKHINPNVIYDIVGSGRPYCEKGLSCEQVWDKVFKAKTAMALRDILKKEGSTVVEMLKVIEDSPKKDVSKWKVVYKLSDSCLVFLEAKYHMLKVSH